MSPKEIVLELYSNDGIRNVTFLNEVLHDNFILEWQSSTGLLTKDKNSYIEFAHELKDNFATFSTDILYSIAENNLVSVACNHFGASIENPKHFILIGRFISVWEFEDGKIIKTYQISKPE